MIINNENVNFKELISFADNNQNLLKRRKNRMLLSNYQIEVLNRIGFNYLNYINYKDLLFDLEEYLNENYDEELDLISNQIAEILYYSETKK